MSETSPLDPDLKIWFQMTFRLTKELGEANKKMKDKDVSSDKKTFLKAQMPKMETEIANLKTAIGELLEEDELDPRGEYFVLAQKLIA